MYFSLEVKVKKEDFFDMERELEALKRDLLDPNTRMIVVKGIRRTGKSSLMRVALNEVKMPHIFIDLRLTGAFSPDDIYYYFSSELSNFLNDKGLRKALSRIKGVEISGLRVEFAERKISLIGKVLEEMNRWAEGKQVVLALDEAQELRNLRGFDKILAHVYDYCRNIKLLLAGSEVGLIDRFIGLNNPNSPLFGRAFSEITLSRLSSDRAFEFLKEGFNQIGLKIQEDEIFDAVKKLDGIIGWLTFYGYLRGKGYSDALERALEEGSRITANEFNLFLANRQPARRRYIEILRTLIRPSTWSEVKRSLRIIANVSDKQISNYLKELVYYGFIVKEGNIYSVADPLLIEAVRRRYIA